MTDTQEFDELLARALGASIADRYDDSELEAARTRTMWKELYERIDEAVSGDKAVVLYMMAGYAYYDGDLEQAALLSNDGLALCSKCTSNEMASVLGTPSVIHSKLLRLSANVRAEQGDDEVARLLYLEAIEIAPHSWEARWSFGSFWISKGRNMVAGCEVFMDSIYGACKDPGDLDVKDFGKLGLAFRIMTDLFSRGVLPDDMREKIVFIGERLESTLAQTKPHMVALLQEIRSALDGLRSG
jgi:hypothetical protein